MRPPRLAVVLSHPTQYYSPWFRWMAARSELELRVFYLWDFGVTKQRDPEFGQAFAWDIDLLSGYAHTFVPNRAAQPGTESFGGLDNPSLPEHLAAWNPDAVLVFGYRYRTHLRLILWAGRRRLPLIFRGDSHLLDAPEPSWLKRWLLRGIYARFASITYVGQANRDYFRAFGVPERKLVFAPHAVECARFDPADETTRQRSAALRRDLGIPADHAVVLFAGKFIPKKQPLELLEAFVAIAPAAASLVFVGAGELESELRTRAAARPTAPIHMRPFANQGEMPAVLHLADVFALPSRGPAETWGLAVNEAMHLGVPALVSTRVGCQRDLVAHRSTGWVFDPTAPGALERALREALSDVAQDRRGFSQRTRARVSNYTYREATEGLLTALRVALS